VNDGKQYPNENAMRLFGRARVTNLYVVSSALAYSRPNQSFRGRMALSDDVGMLFT
jgi:hypothetical protein